MHRLRFTAWFEDPAIGAQYDVLLYKEERPISPGLIEYLWSDIVRPVVLNHCSLAGPVVEYRFQILEGDDV